MSIAILHLLTSAELIDAREWLMDCEWADEDAESIAEMSDETIRRAVQRHYDGGLRAFIADMDRR
jgi:hypothetical protein